MSQEKLQTPAERYKNSPYAYLFEDDTKTFEEPSKSVMCIDEWDICENEQDDDEDDIAIVEEDETDGLSGAMLALWMDAQWKAKRLKEIQKAMTYTRSWDMVEDWGARVAGMRLVLKAAGDLQDKQENASHKLLQRIFQRALQNSSR